VHLNGVVLNDTIGHAQDFTSVLTV
jgi:hypothetical protein